MSVNAAIKKLENQCEFLGVDWDRLMYLCRTQPMMFPVSVMNAFDVYLESVDRVLEAL
jgi:hypothetical protein